MTLQDLLNSDLGVIGRWIRQGWLWWIQELANLVPLRLQGRRKTHAPWRAEMTSEEGPIRLWKNGASVAVLDAADGMSRSADLLLPNGAVLVRELDLPHLSTPNMNRLLHLNIDRFTPFQAEQVYFDTEVIHQKEGGQNQRVRLAVVARERADAMLTRAQALGMTVERMGVGTGEAPGETQFDFMPAIRREAGGDVRHRRRIWLWGACAILVVMTLLVAVGRDMRQVAQLQRLVDLQQPTVVLAGRLRERVETEQSRRLALLSRRSIHEPLRILDAVTKAFPREEWVQRLEWNGRAVRLVGFRRVDFDVLTALQGSALHNPRSLLSDMPTKTPQGLAPFDVMADSAARSPR